MAPGFFWCRVSSLGVLPDEENALDRGEPMTAERQADLNVRIEAARVALLNAPALVPYVRSF